MLRIKDRHERDMLYGPTNEEMITEIFRAYVRSYKDIPLNLYHIQWKFRDEVRPRFGLMRGREFLMKDAYSFDVDQAGARHSYNKMFVAYLRTFARMGLKAIPMARRYRTDRRQSVATNSSSSPRPARAKCSATRTISISPVPGAGRRISTTSRVCRASSINGRRSMPRPRRSTMRRLSDKLPADKQVSARGIEVGHIFYFGTKYSEPMKAVVAGPDGVEKPVHMGSYGIGPSRLVAAIIEASHDDAGIIWPEAVAPFKVAILNLKQGDGATDGACEKLYEAFRTRGIDVLYDDLDQRPGAKFATADLIGVPWQILVGPKGLANGQVEVKKRSDGSREMLDPEDAVARLSSNP